MKFLILAFVCLAVASASLFGGKTVNVLDDGTILVRTDTGKQIIISKKMGLNGQGVTEIDVTGPFAMGKKIQIDENNMVKVSPGTGTLDMITPDMDRLKRSPKITTQADAVAEIEKEFQGVINQAGFDKLLAKVQKSVTKGKLDSTVVDYLQALEETQPWHTTTTTTTQAPTTQAPELKTQGLMGVNQLPWYMCNDITCFKQMMMMNSMYQKAPLMTYDQYMRMNVYNKMPMNQMMYNTPMNYRSMYPINPMMGYQGFPIRESQLDSGMVNSDLVPKKNFWNTYMNKLNMNSFASQYDDQQQQVPVVPENKMYYAY